MNEWYTFQLQKVDCEAGRDLGVGRERDRKVD